MTELASERRWVGTQRLYGTQFERLRSATVMVVGLGGVGSWAAEALARSGVGRLVLVDLDHVAESNLNRQAQATWVTVGAAKVSAMTERIHSFAPDCEVVAVDDFLDEHNAFALLSGETTQARPTAVIDAVDQVKAKLAMVLSCRRLRLPLVVSGGAGGKTDPTMLRRADLSLTQQDPLLAKLRAKLRKEHAFPRLGRMRVTCVYSEEPMRRVPAAEGCVVDPSAGLACAGYGSVVTVTAALGLAAAAAVMNGV